MSKVKRRKKLQYCASIYPKVNPQKSQLMFKAKLITFVEAKYRTPITQRKGEGHFPPEEPPLAPPLH